MNPRSTFARFTIFELAPRLLANTDRRLPRVSAIRPYETQIRKSSNYLGYDRLRAVPVLNVRVVNDHVQRQPLGIHDDMPLAPVHFFAGVVPA